MKAILKVNSLIKAVYETKNEELIEELELIRFNFVEEDVEDVEETILERFSEVILNLFDKYFKTENFYASEDFLISI
jgi:hypothetical protein